MSDARRLKTRCLQTEEYYRYVADKPKDVSSSADQKRKSIHIETIVDFPRGELILYRWLVCELKYGVCKALRPAGLIWKRALILCGCKCCVVIWADAETELSDDERRTDFSFSPPHSHALCLLFIHSKHRIQWQSAGILAVLVAVMTERFIVVG